MPSRKKKNPNEMSDRELLRAVFPERVARRIEEEVEYESPAIERDSGRDHPSTSEDK